MAKAWGAAWGDAWGLSWGTAGSEPPAPPPPHVESIGSYGSEDPTAERRRVNSLFVMQIAIALVTSGALE